MAVLVCLLGPVFQAERRRSFTGGTFILNLSELLSRTLDSGISNEVVPFSGRFREDVSSDFRGVAGRSSRMEGSNQDHLYFFSKIYTQKCNVTLYYSY